jgi:hypothetical protein
LINFDFKKKILFYIAVHLSIMELGYYKIFSLIFMVVVWLSRMSLRMIEKSSKFVSFPMPEGFGKGR